VADVFDAMTSRRAYKKAIPNTDVRGYVRDESGRTFDPRLVRVLDLMLGRLEEETPEEDARGRTA
jgi:putative two-component system response regulator